MRWSGAKGHSPRALTVNWPQPPWHTLCTAAAPHPSLQSSVGLQLEQIAATGTAAEKALLAELKSKNPDATYIELLRLFKVHRRRWAVAALVATGACRIDASARRCHT